MRRPPSRIVTSCSPSMGASRCGRTRNSTFTSHWAGGIMRGSEAISSARKSPWSTRSSSRGSTRFISIVDSTRRPACGSSSSTDARVGLLPGGPIELPFLFRLLPELLVVVPAQMDAPRFADQLELGEDLFHFLRREGPLRFLPATLHPADLVRGHGCGDASGDICTCAVPTEFWGSPRGTCDCRYFSLRRNMCAAARETIASAATTAASEPGSNAGRGAGGGRLTMSTDTAASDGR